MKNIQHFPLLFTDQGSPPKLLERRRMKTNRGWLQLLIAALIVAASGYAQAAPVLITSRAALGSNDFVDWGVLGPTFVQVPDPFDIASSSGALTLNVDNPSGVLQRGDQPLGWDGNFAMGDHVLFTFGSPGPVRILTPPIRGAGLQMQSNQFGPFDAIIKAFDVNNVEIASFSRPGNASNAGDNSAVFIGVLDTLGNIRRIEFSVLSPGRPSNDFAFNRLDIVRVPEPCAAMWLLMVAAWRVHRRVRPRPVDSAEGVQLAAISSTPVEAP